MPFLTETKRVQALRAIHGQHAIYVVDLVLKKLRAVTFDLHFRPFSLQVLIPDPDSVRSRYSHE
jgi:hypothetical protein